MKKLLTTLTLFITSLGFSQNYFYNIFDPYPTTLNDFTTVYTYYDTGDTSNLYVAYSYNNLYEYLPESMRPNMTHPLTSQYLGNRVSSLITMDSVINGTLRYQNGGTGLNTIGTNGQMLRSTGNAYQWFTPNFSTDTSSLSNRINNKLNISDTTNKWLGKPNGTTSQYIRGNGSIVAFPSIPSQVNISGSNGITVPGSYPNIDVAKTKRQEPYTGTTNGSGNYTVTFSQAYSVAPNIQVCLVNADVRDTPIVTISSTGFTVNIQRRTDVIGLLPTYANVSGGAVDVLITEK